MEGRRPRFTIFQPKHEKRKPSEWALVLFVLHKAFGRFQFVRRLWGKAKPGEVPPIKKGSMQYYPDLALPEELAESKTQAKVQRIGATEVRKKSSVRDRFVSMVFRRGAFSPSAAADYE